jgi:hypothetical protein
MSYYFHKNAFYLLPCVRVDYFRRMKVLLHLEFSVSWLWFSFYYEIRNWK